MAEAQVMPRGQGEQREGGGGVSHRNYCIKRLDRSLQYTNLAYHTGLQLQQAASRWRYLFRP